MKRLALALFVVLVAAPLNVINAAEEQVNYFPSVMYGHILAGTSASRYETTIVLRSQKGGRVHVDIFDENSEPMEASFVDQNGDVAATTSSFAFAVQPGRTLQIKIQLPVDDAADEIAVRTGWATVTSLEEVEASALIQITTADGRLVTRQFMNAERPMRS